MNDAKRSRTSQLSLNLPSEITRKSFQEESKSSRLILTDIINGFNEPLLNHSTSPSSCSNFFINPQFWFLITVISISCAVFAYAIDFTCLGLSRARKTLVSDPDNTQSPILEFLIWISFSLAFVLIAASCGKFISQDAEGSGIPEMKALIGGAEIKRYLSPLTLCSKVVGLIAANTAGLSIGREGPFIHISCIIASLISSLPFFSGIVNPSRKKQILAVAVAVGVSVTFGSPIGGLLFSIEVTATYYNVGNLWKSLYAAFLCSLIFKFFEIDELTNLITSRHYGGAVLGWEMLPFFVQGAAFGVVGASFVHLTGLVIHMKKNNREHWLFQRYTYVVVVCLICSTMMFVAEINQVGDRAIISNVFKPDRLSVTFPGNISENIIWHLAIYALGKFFMTIISISCPIPCGVFTPIFALGAVLGRLYGELLHTIYLGTHPGVYALVGAACLASSVTHTISVAVIVFELSGQINYLPFMLTAVLTSYTVTVLLSSNIYDLLISLKNIPYMPSLKKIEFYQQSAKILVCNIEKSLINVTSMRNIWLAIICNANTLNYIPVVDDSEFVIGEVSVKNLIDFVHSEYLKIRENLVNKVSYDRYFEIVAEVVSDEREVLDLEKCFVILNQFVEGQCLVEKELSEFWKNKVLLQYSVEVELSPFVINEDASIVKVHYLFLVLNLYQIYVLQRGKLVGVITRQSFLQFSS